MYADLKIKGGVMIKKARYLIVDDSRFMRLSLRQYLEEMGARYIEEASNVEEAMKKYEEFKPNVITVDIIMPGGTGLEIVKKIRERDKECKIIVVSAMGQENVVVEAIEKGANHFILKPVSFDKFKKALERVLNE